MRDKSDKIPFRLTAPCIFGCPTKINLTNTFFCDPCFTFLLSQAFYRFLSLVTLKLQFMGRTPKIAKFMTQLCHL